MAKELIMLPDESNALLVLLRAGYRVTLYKETDKYHCIERVYSLPPKTDAVEFFNLKSVGFGIRKPESDGK